MRFIQTTGIAAAVALAASIGFTAPAWAGGAPTPCQTSSESGAPAGPPGATNYGGDCSISGTINITSAIQLATNETAFTLSGTALDTPSPTFQIQIASNVPTGYEVEIDGPPNGFVSPGAPTNLPDAAVSVSAAGQLSSGSNCTNTESGFAARYLPLPDPSATPTALEVVGQAGVSGPYNCGTFSGYTVPTGDDSFDVNGFELTTVNGEQSGTYTGNVQMAAWGN